MNEYKSLSKYLKKKDQDSKVKKFLLKLSKQVLVCVILLLVGLIVLKYDKQNSNKIHKFLYENNISFASINKAYQKYFGSIFPKNKNTQKVFDEKLEYNEANIYKDGVALTTKDNYLVPIIESGIVIFVGEKENYGNTIIIQGEDKKNIWYGNLTNINVNLYDYVTKGEFLGEASNNTLYLVYEQDGKYLNYKDYLK